jgi:NDP-sugar pyrophosphorylase family protein
MTANMDASKSELLELMQRKVLRHIPLIDNEERVVDLVMLNDLTPTKELPLDAIIMAGGFGTRLRPLTKDIPKPMLELGGKPLLERIIMQLKESGITSITLSTHYKSDKIIDHFGDGCDYGVNLSYVKEEQPLGTGGALSLLPTPSKPVLVINGDILTEVNFRTMFEFHQEQKADLTVAVRRYEIQVPFGVIECSGTNVKQIHEKPEVSFLVNAGFYLLSPSVFQFIPKNEYYNMTELIQKLLEENFSVVSFPVHEYWIDIGQHADYIKAQDDINKGRI